MDYNVISCKKNWKKHSKNQNRWFYYVIPAPELRNDKTVNTVSKNRYGHNFQNIASQTNQRWLMNYEKPLIHFGIDILKIVAVFVFFDTS